jgi:uncharacterized protein (TIGR02757 family)
MRLKRYLDQFIDEFPREEHLARDPVSMVHRYDDPADREVVGFLASAFAYGNVRAVLATVEAILRVVGPRPREFVLAFDPRRDGARFRGFTHRWNNARDLAVLLWILGRLLEEHGTIEAGVVRAMEAGDATVARGLDGFAEGALGYGHERFYTGRDLASRRGVRYFFPRVSDGSACKRLNLYLRWMVRPADGVDCGVWTRVRPSQLVIPLDTHLARISRYIGLTAYLSPGWAMAEDVTRSLRRLDPSDPVRYDFALCHLGIAGDCPKRRDPVKCRRCPIQAVCRL